MPVTCQILEGKVHIVTLSGLHDPMIIDLERISRKLRRDISYNVELELQKRQVLGVTERLPFTSMVVPLLKSKWAGNDTFEHKSPPNYPTGVSI